MPDNSFLHHFTNEMSQISPIHENVEKHNPLSKTANKAIASAAQVVEPYAKKAAETANRVGETFSKYPNIAPLVIGAATTPLDVMGHVHTVPPHAQKKMQQIGLPGLMQRQIPVRTFNVWLGTQLVDVGMEASKLLRGKNPNEKSDAIDRLAGAVAHSVVGFPFAYPSGQLKSGEPIKKALELTADALKSAHRLKSPFQKHFVANTSSFGVSIVSLTPTENILKNDFGMSEKSAKHTANLLVALAASAVGQARNYSLMENMKPYAKRAIPWIAAKDFLGAWLYNNVFQNHKGEGEKSPPSAGASGPDLAAQSSAQKTTQNRASSPLENTLRTYSSSIDVPKLLEQRVLPRSNAGSRESFCR